MLFLPLNLYMPLVFLFLSSDASLVSNACLIKRRFAGLSLRGVIPLEANLVSWSSSLTFFIISSFFIFGVNGDSLAPIWSSLIRIASLLSWCESYSYSGRNLSRAPLTCYVVALLWIIARGKLQVSSDHVLLKPWLKPWKSFYPGELFLL